MKTLKRIIALSIVAMVCGACSNDFESADMRNTVKLRSQEEAISIAQDAYATFNTKESRNGKKIAIAKNGVSVVKGRSSRGLANDTLMFVVNFEDSLGFALVSANTNALPLIGIAESGYYDPEEPGDDENFNFFMECASAYLANNNEPSSITPSGPIVILPMEVAPKIPVLWGQGSPYGDAIGNRTAGCANTATAQIMAYFKQPQHIVLTYFHGTYYNPTLDLDWDLMIQHKQTPNLCNEDEVHTAHNMIRNLFAQIHEVNNSYPSGSATGTDPENCYNSLNYYGYTCTEPRSFSNVNYRNYLSNNYVLYAIGFSTYSSGGHAWIMDGYKTIVPTTYCHYNWGWDGSNNGYFAANVFDTTAAYSFDGSNDGLHDYNFNRNVTLSAVTY